VRLDAAVPQRVGHPTGTVLIHARQATVSRKSPIRAEPSVIPTRDRRRLTELLREQVGVPPAAETAADAWQVAAEQPADRWLSSVPDASTIIRSD
jgi:hypothetical protein